MSEPLDPRLLAEVPTDLLLEEILCRFDAAVFHGATVTTTDGAKGIARIRTKGNRFTCLGLLRAHTMALESTLFAMLHGKDLRDDEDDQP